MQSDMSVNPQFIKYDLKGIWQKLNFVMFKVMIVYTDLTVDCHFVASSSYIYLENDV